MTVQKGSEFLLGREDATYAGSFNIIGGQQGGQLTFEDQAAEFTHKTSTGLWTEIMDGGTVRKVTMTLDSVVIEDAEYAAILAGIMGTSTRHESLMALLPGIGAITGDFQVTANGVSGALNEPEKFNITATSAESVVLVPGIKDRFGLESALVLDFVAASYWASGVHVTDFASLSGLSAVRASTKTDAGGWNFTNGGAVGALTEYAANVAAIHATAGFLVEESTTNEIRNPRCEGATGTTPPTHWRNSGSDMTLTFEVVEVDGWPGVRVTGTSGGAAEELSLYFEGTQQTAAAQSEDWTASIGIAEESGPALTSAQLIMYEYDSGGSELTSGGGSSFSDSLDTTHRRFVHPRTLTDGSTAYVAPRLQIVFAAAGAFSFVLFAPQNEQKEYATSPVFPTVSSPATVTRAADTFSSTLGGWFNSTAFSVEFAGQVGRLFSGDDARCLSIDDGSSSDRLNMNLQPSGNLEVFLAAASATQISVSAPTAAAAGDSVRYIAAVSADDAAVSYRGQDQDTDGSVTMPSGLTTLRFGDWHSTANRQFGGYITAIRIWPSRLTDSDLETAVGN